VSVVIDRMLVRAPVGLVYKALTDVDGWDLWWSGCRTSRAEGAGDHHRIVIGRWWRRTVRMHVHGWRHDVGMHLELSDRRGRHAGAAEWWLEACPEGTLVTHLLHEATLERPTDAYRRAVRRGMHELKDHLELAVDVALGRVP
jgi:uncharacterized protein YndB with AHSA1/START domain